MIPSLKSVADFIAHQNVLWVNNDNCLLYAAISCMVAITIIFCVLAIVKVVEMSPTLNFIMFGIKPKKNG